MLTFGLISAKLVPTGAPTAHLAHSTRRPGLRVGRLGAVSLAPGAQNRTRPRELGVATSGFNLQLALWATPTWSPNERKRDQIGQVSPLVQGVRINQGHHLLLIPATCNGFGSQPSPSWSRSRSRSRSRRPSEFIGRERPLWTSERQPPGLVTFGACRAHLWPCFAPMGRMINRRKGIPTGQLADRRRTR